MDYLLTFIEGVLTFVSPCLLPLMPVYVAYFAGDSPVEEAGDAQADRSPRRASAGLRVGGFILGFTLLFVALGALAGSIGSALQQHSTLLNAVCGIIIIVLGLGYLGLFRIPTLQRFMHPRTGRGRGFWPSVLFGIVFAVGWTPCTGAFLGSALALAAVGSSMVHGIVLLVCYSLGLGLPLFITALLIDRLEGAFAWVKRHYAVIDKVCGVLLIVMGVCVAFGWMNTWLGMLSRL